MPRLFTALEIPPDIAGEFELVRGGIPGARWIEPASLHLTLRFIGDVEAPVAHELRYALSSIEGYPFELSLKGMGAFGGTKPRAIWAGTEPSGALLALQADHEALCRRIGLAPETRQYTPHVTIARLSRGWEVSDAVQQFVARHGLFQSRVFDVTQFVLLSARPSRGGGPYVEEEIYPLIPAM